MGFQRWDGQVDPTTGGFREDLVCGFTIQAITERNGHCEELSSLFVRRNVLPAPNENTPIMAVQKVRAFTRAVVTVSAASAFEVASDTVSHAGVLARARRTTSLKFLVNMAVVFINAMFEKAPESAAPGVRCQTNSQNRPFKF